MDNAQMTSQMAQMSTVTGIEQVNATLKSMTEQFNTLQVTAGCQLGGPQRTHARQHIGGD